MLNVPIRCCARAWAMRLLAAVAWSSWAGLSLAQGPPAGAVFTAQAPAAQPQYLPPGSRPTEAFKLGVTARNTPTGLQIDQVMANGLAQRSGLEAGDTIVNVSGYQIGYVNGRLIDLTDELARRSDTQGRVTVLVHNHRNRALANVPLQFSMTAPAGRVVTGRVSAQFSQAISPSAVLLVRLLDVTRPEWSDVTVAEQTIPNIKQFPIGYRLDLPSQNIRPDHRYALDARLSDRGYVLLQTPTPVPTVLSAQGNRVDLALQPTAVRPPSQPVPYDQITKTFVDLLGRQPTARELTTWQQHLTRGGSINDVRVSILSSSEFYDRYRNDPQQYVAGVYSALYGASHTAAATTTHAETAGAGRRPSRLRGRSRVPPKL